MSEDVRFVLEHHRFHLQKSINKLTRSLAEFSDDDPLSEGERLLLEAQQRHMTHLKDLMVYADDKAKLLAELQLRVAAASYAHEQAIQRDHNLAHIPGEHSDAWWNTLNEQEFLSHLLVELEKAD